jgi:arginyl-tRNA synthetase
MNQSVYVVGNEQDYHFKVLFSVLRKLNRPYADGLHHLSYGMVDLPSGRMKSREGTVVDADDLMQEMVDTSKKMIRELGKVEEFNTTEFDELAETVGIGALKYFLLKVDPVKRMLFDPEESIELHGHTATFIQYVHARISAIVRKAAEETLPPFGDSYALHESEKAVIVQLAEFPAAVREAGEKYSPAVIANYCYELTKTYNRFYDDCSIFKAETREQVAFRVALSATVGKVIKNGMKLLGIKVPDRM